MSPLTKNTFDSVASLGEEKLIAAIRRWLGPASPPSPHGIGDDCAVLPASTYQQVITVDPVIYGRHFDDQVPPRAVGAKLLKRNLSDLAAMGAQPTAAVVALTLDPRVSLSWLEKFYRGLAACARDYRVPIVGGDIAQADGIIAASLTLLGQATGPRLLLRTGAKIGDWIYTTGKLGGSLTSHHFDFSPRLAEGAWLAARAETRAMIDLSDGLAKDLPALTPVNAEPFITATDVPISLDATRLAKKSGRTPLAHALSDGEDYELLFVVAKNTDLGAFELAWRRRFKTPLFCLGRFVRQGERPAGSIDLGDYHGYEHLR
jgi:thiamine-monophosphate kinase